MTKAEVLALAVKGEGCLGRAADDEPVFVLVAHDRVAADTVRDWLVRARRVGTGGAKVAGAAQDAKDMDVYREAHGGGKVPD